MAKIKTLAAIILPLLAFAPVAAEQSVQPAYVMPRIPSEAEKIAALKLGYQINGNSMVKTDSSIDLSREDLRPADPMPQHPASAAKIVPEPRRKSRLIARESPAQP